MDNIIEFFTSTMLIERLIGVGVYALTLGYFYNKIQHAKSARSISRYLNLYLILLCIMAFFYIPGTSADLYRWRNLALPWENASFLWFWTYRVLPSRTPLGYLLIYACQMTKIEGLLPMVCALVFFGNIFHILKCEVRRGNISSDSVAVVLLFIMSSGVFLEVISSMRCMLSFVIVLRCVYDEMYKREGFIKHIPFYIIATLLHNAALPLIGCRLVCMLFEGGKSAILTIINIFTVLITFIAAIRFGDDFIDAAFSKASSYVTHDIYSYNWEYIIAGLGITIIIRVLWKYMKRYRDQWRREIVRLRYLLLLVAGDLIFVGIYSIFHRYHTAVIIASIPALLTFLDREHRNGLIGSRKLIVQTSLVILLLACTRGNLCGYKFFLLN